MAGSRKNEIFPIVTDLRRRVQPIIRYKLDDIILNKPEVRFIFRGIAQIIGRCGDCLTFRNQVNQPVKIFPDLLQREISLMCAKRVDYRIIQTQKNRILIESDQDHEQINQAIVRVLNRFGCNPVHVDYGQAPPWSGQQKLRRVVNRCDS